MRSGAYDQARTSLDRLLILDPHSLPGHLTMADVEMRSGNVDAAIKHFRTAAALDPNSFPAHYGLALALLRVGNRGEAESELRRAAAHRPPHADALYNLGVLLLDDGKSDEALAKLQAAKRLGPNRPDLAFNLIRAEISNHQSLLAKKELAQSVAEFGQDPAWRFATGNLFLSAGMADEAIKQLTIAHHLKPVDAEIRIQLCKALLAGNQPATVLSLGDDSSSAEEAYLRALAAYQLGRLGEAENYLGGALDSSTDNPQYLLLRAKIWQRNGQQQQALNVLQKIANNVPNLAEVFYSEAVSYYFLEDYNSVRKSLDQALAIAPQTAQYLFLYAITYENEGHDAEAVNLLKRTIALDPENARFELHLGTALLRENQIEGARQALLRAIALKPDYAVPHYYLGKILAREGELPAAGKELETAIRYQPDLAAALYQLGRVYAAEGKAELAAATLERFKLLRNQETQDEAVSKQEMARELR